MGGVNWAPLGSFLHLLWGFKFVLIKLLFHVVSLNERLAASVPHIGNIHCIAINIIDQFAVSMYYHTAEAFGTFGHQRLAKTDAGIADDVYDPFPNISVKIPRCFPAKYSRNVAGSLFSLPLSIGSPFRFHKVAKNSSISLSASSAVIHRPAFTSANAWSMRAFSSSIV